MDYYFYILKNDQNKLYIGQTTDLNKRLAYHNRGNGSLFTSRFKNFKLVYFEKYNSLITAMKRERQVKGWTRCKKEALITGDIELLRGL